MQLAAVPSQLAVAPVEGDNGIVTTRRVYTERFL